MKVDQNYESFSERWISDGIKDGYKKWEKSQPLHSATHVFIESPTGTGKTHFFINELLPYSIEMSRSILYICNRDALKEQTVQAVKESLPDPVLDDDQIGKISIFTVSSSTKIAIANYQSLRAENSRNCLKYALTNLYYIIFDEVHFFLEDALFNVDTAAIYANLMYDYMNPVHIFMSATMEDFYRYYVDTFKYFIPDHVAPVEHEALYHFHITYYRNLYSRPSYNIILYKNEEFLLDEINKSQDEKWLIFVSSKNDGAELKKIIKIQKQKKCAFLYSQNKNNNIWQKLVQTSSFDKDILIATKVLDNGANIKDDTLKYIVVPFAYPTDFIQMLGRKRFGDKTSTPINVYVKQPSIQEINSKLRKFQKAFDFIQGMDGKVNINTNRGVSVHKGLQTIKEYWKNPEYNNLFDFQYKLSQINFEVNVLAKYKLSLLANFYKKLKDKHNNTQVHIDYLKSWLGNSIAGLKYENTPSKMFDLEKFLNDQIGKHICDTESFYRVFDELYSMHCFNKYFMNGNEEEFKNAVKIRKAPNQRKATINRSLRFLGLPYTLEKENNGWVLTELPQ